jgi:hypothetical protein
MSQKLKKVTKKSNSWKTKCGLLFCGVILGLIIFPLFNPTIKKLGPYTHKLYNVCLESASDILNQSSFYLIKAQNALKDKLKKNNDDKGFVDPLS